MGRETLEMMKTMKTKLTILLVALCGVFATTSVFGQTTYVWTNQAGGDIATAANWDPNGVPSPTTGPDAETGTIYGDEMLFDGRTTGDLSLTANTGQTGFSGSAWGLRFHLTSNQTKAVNIHSPVTQSGGTRCNSITIDAGAGAFSLGDNTANVLDTLWGGTGGQVHTWVNESTNPVVLYPNVRWRYGGGGFHTFDLGGSGDWIVNNYFRHNNPPAGTGVTKSGSGTMTWTGTNVGSAVSANLIGAATVNGGTLILKTWDLLSAQNINNDVDGAGGTLLKYDAASGDGVFSGVISGAGPIEVSAGKLTLSGNNTYTGSNYLTGGELIVGLDEDPSGTFGPLGVGGTISFTGGTLVYRVNNVFDYSPRFSTAAGQAYSIDTAGQNVTFTNSTGLSGAGNTLTKVGSGTLTLAGPSTYTGLTTVSAGKLVFQGTKTGSGNITVADGAILGVTATGSQITPGTLTMGSSAGATIGFNNVNSTTTAPIAAGTISYAGTITINVNSGTFTPGLSYPLLSWTSGSAPAVSLGVLNGYIGNLSINANTIVLNVTAAAYKWTGNNNGNWDTTTANNWVLNGGPVVFADGGPVMFDDTTTITNVTIRGVVQPSSITVNNDSLVYSLASSSGNNIGGSATLTKNGSKTLTLSGGANAYTGVTTISGGTVSVGALANGGSACDIGAASSDAANLVLDGGVLAYTGSGASIDRLFTLTMAGGTINADSDSGALALNNNGSLGYRGNGPRALTLSGTNMAGNTLAASIADSGGATSLTKSGAGTWVLTGSNTYSGGTMVASGLLQIGAGGASGSLGSGSVLNSGQLVFNRTGTLTLSGAVSGTGAVTNDGTGTVILAGNNSYSGGTTINAGTLQVGTGGATGCLATEGAMVNNGTLIFDTTGSFTYSGNGLISGTGNVIIRGNGGKIKAIGANSYTGWTLIDSGATFVPTEGNLGNVSALASSVVTNNGILRFMAYDTRTPYYGNIVGSGKVQMGANNAAFDAGEIVLAGTNTYTGGTYIGGNHLVFGDAATAGAGSFTGNVYFVNNFETPDDTVRRLIFDRPDDFTFSGNIVTNFSSAQNNLGIVTHRGYGILTLTGTNTYGGGTVITAGTVQVGNGGTSGTIGSGPVTDDGLLVWNRSDDVTFDGVISGTGSLVKTGSGTLTLTASNTYAATTTVSNGTLVVNGDNSTSITTVNRGTLGGRGVFNGPVMLDAGTTLAPGASVGSVGTLTINSDLSIGGNIAIEVNKSLSPSSDLVVVSGGLSKIGTGTLTVTNLGPALAVGDKFTLFSKPVDNGAALTVTGGGATWANNLAVDGSITALTVSAPPIPTTPTNMVYTVSDSDLTISWPASYIGWGLQSNSVSVADPSMWFTVTGSTTTNLMILPLDPTKTNVFYRMHYRP
jgi:fibronectin-binding autotransporter adhesin